MPVSSLDETLVGAMIARASHLEQILVTSLLGLLITTTFGLMTAIYTSYKEPEIWRRTEKGWFILGIAFIYMCISGYYYYMLAHFYAAVQSAFALIKDPGSQVAVAPIWQLFRLPEMFWLSPKQRAMGYLALAPAFPVGFSCVAIFAFWWMLRKGPVGTKPVSVAVLLSSVAMQVLMAYLLAGYPFSTFIRSIETYIDREAVAVERP